jgi:RimJ/RimL family protein N-acetyltransferase
MIQGNLIYLRPMEIEDVKYKVEWVNDHEVRKTLVYSDYPASILGTEQWLRKVSGDPGRKNFMVCLKADHRTVGFAGVKGIDRVNLKCESFMGIGVKDYWGKGLGYDIKKALLEYCFSELQLNKVYSMHLADNQAMVRINLKLGGKLEGTLREDVWHNGKFHDMVIISVLKSEFIKN